MSTPGEIVTLGVGSFGVLAATQWANGLTQFEAENSSCAFQELNRRGARGAGETRAVRAVFLDQTYRSGIRHEHAVDGAHARALDTALDAAAGSESRVARGGRAGDTLAVVDAVSTRERQQQHDEADAARTLTRRSARSNGNDERDGDSSDSAEKDENDDDDDSDDSGSGRARKWPTTSAQSRWARGNVSSSDDESAPGDDGDNDDASTDGGAAHAGVAASAGAHGQAPASRGIRQPRGASATSDSKARGGDAAARVARRVANAARRAPGAGPHHPWWQYLTAPHHADLARCVSFVDLPSATESGGWSQLRSFAFGLHDGGVHAQLVDHAQRGASCFVDNIRKEVEACDRLQGVQLFVDADSAFGGIATHIASHHLADDFGIRDTLAVACFPDPGELHVGVRRRGGTNRHHNNSNNNTASSDCHNSSATTTTKTNSGNNVNDIQGAPSSSRHQHDGNLLPDTIDRQMEDHRNLNRGLSTSLLSHACGGYVPHEVISWTNVFRAYRPVLPGLCTEDDVAAAQVVATWTDSVLLPCRGIVSTASNGSNNSCSDAVSVTGEHLQHCAHGFSAGQLLQLLRPAPSLRIAAAFLALPFSSTAVGSAPTLPSARASARGASGAAQSQSQSATANQQQQQQRGANDIAARQLFNILDSAAPLLAMSRGNFRPLSGIVVDPALTNTRAHTVVAHAFTLRGALPFGATVDRAALHEALLQFTSPVRCAAFVGFAVAQLAPLSGTFPRGILLPREIVAAAASTRAPPHSAVAASGSGEEHDRRMHAQAQEHQQQPEQNKQEQDPPQRQEQAQQLERRAQLDHIASLRSISTGAHVLTTHAAGPYLQSVQSAALRRSMALRGEAARAAMGVDGDSWREVEEDLAALRDSYDYEDPTGNDSGDDVEA